MRDIHPGFHAAIDDILLTVCRHRAPCEPFALRGPHRLSTNIVALINDYRRPSTILPARLRKLYDGLISEGSLFESPNSASSYHQWWLKTSTVYRLLVEVPRRWDLVEVVVTPSFLRPEGYGEVPFSAPIPAIIPRANGLSLARLSPAVRHMQKEIFGEIAGFESTAPPFPLFRRLFFIAQPDEIRETTFRPTFEELFTAFNFSDINKPWIADDFIDFAPYRHRGNSATAAAFKLLLQVQCFLLSRCVVICPKSRSRKFIPTVQFLAEIIDAIIVGNDTSSACVV